MAHGCESSLFAVPAWLVVQKDLFCIKNGNQLYTADIFCSGIFQTREACFWPKQQPVLLTKKLSRSLRREVNKDK